MSAHRDHQEFRNREFASFLRARGQLPPPRAHPQSQPQSHPQYPPPRPFPLPAPAPGPAAGTAPPNPGPPPALPTPVSDFSPPPLRPVTSALAASPAPVPYDQRVPLSSGFSIQSVPMTLSNLAESPVVQLPHLYEGGDRLGYPKRERAAEDAVADQSSRLRGGVARNDPLDSTSPTTVGNTVAPRSISVADFGKSPRNVNKRPRISQSSASKSSTDTEEAADESDISRVFDCELCDNKFYRKHHLERHIQNIHEGQRPWICNECGFAFHQKPNLDRHIMTVHEEQRPFRCEICELSFGRKGVLKKHVQMVHEHSRKFECDQCKMAFGLKSDMKRHSQSVHQKMRPFVCFICGASFGRKSDLKRHTASLHPGAELPSQSQGGSAGGPSATSS